MMAPMSLAELDAGDGVTLRRVRPEDAQEIYAEIDRSRKRLREWMPWVDGTTAPGDVLEFVERALEQESDGNGFHCTIQFEGRLAGLVGLVYVNQKSRKAEIGYWIGQSFEGRGIMTRAVRTLTGYLFSEMGMHRVEIQAGEDNHRSCAVAKRLGFVPEGIKREAEWVNDRFVNLAVYSMLERDWSD